MFSLILLSLTVAVAYGGVRRGLTEYLEGLDLDRSN
jgi:hypothetical protein